MSTEQIIEGDKLIAEFDGLILHGSMVLLFNSAA